MRNHLGPIVSLALTALLAGCGGKSPAPAARAEIVLHNEKRERERFGLEMKALLLAGQYDSLDSVASRLKRDRTRWANGDWKLRAFYYEGFDTSVADDDSAGHRDIVDALKTWVAQRPQSVAAHVALANALIGFAWQARGNGNATTITETASRLMAARLAEAKAALTGAGPDAANDPGWWSAAQRIALGEGWDRPTYDRLVAEASRGEPSFEAVYQLKAFHLLPRWYGSAGEWEGYADSVADGLGAEGDLVYARIVWYLHDRFNNIFQESSASWERTRLGFESLVQRYPESLELKSAFAYLAYLAEDRVTARHAFDQIGPRIDPGVWDDAAFFERAEYWSRPIGP